MHTGKALAAMAVLAVSGAVRAQSNVSPTTKPATTQVTTTSPAAPPATAASPGELGRVVVTSDLDLTRDEIAPSLGAVTYTLGPKQIQTTPQGENAPFQQVLLRAPGVVDDSFGQVHVRGEHANLTYRVNGIILPEGLNGFAQELDTRLISSVTLIDGSLPAQFGFRTAGIVDVTTKSGDTITGNEISLYGGSQETFQPSIQLGGTTGKLDYFFTGTSNHNQLGIENPTPDSHASHDRTDQEKVFGYLSYRIDETSRISLLLNVSNATFQIPDTPGLTPAFPLAGHPGAALANSLSINENQIEQQYYTVLAYQKSIDKLSLQVAGFTRYGQIHFTPDVTNDLSFQGVSGDVLNSFFTNGIQLDASYVLNDAHTIRTGFIGDFTAERLKTSTDVFPVDPLTGLTTSDVPLNIADHSGNHGASAGIYVQDEWRLSRQFTLNYGLRYDRFDTNFNDSGQLSPRANLVWKINNSSTAHAGYSRYFVPPPLQYVGPTTINKFAGTTNAPENFISDPLKVERSNYFDVGVSRQITKPWKVNVDAFYKDAHNLIDNGQFGDAVIITPFNYRVGTVYGAELSSTFNAGGFSAFGNFSWVLTRGEDIISQQFLFDNAELAYIHDHGIKLDHEGEYTASVGLSYSWKNDTVYIDAIYGSGLRSGFANLQKLPQYAPVNVGYEHVFHPDGWAKNEMTFRFDVINILDEAYVIRDGSGVGVEAPQYGARRAFFGGLSYRF